ncbi:dehydrogenase [Paenibacillus sp. FSL R7-0273]|uniref:zinc-dependent alcohol dehydrogenase n=1 Tax=Paenibacillus sp. FSL R7-0273 TaxID=1536772 RepID=UPI0004F58EF1|nr:zinc-dependent alcohol dehydrogenase [Paenibacillus sp. FSL R7-0273]AIQ47503.1 dehydrogenase [Paenibacillus sp. FSL R7-0273]OMF95937.1 glutathione-dependent formaldehyde dehydrogenase [Paenibacillus sp. FSL R7-0273]
MKAVTYQGKKKVEVKEVADAKLEKKDDILIRVTSTAICGSDLHIYNGAIPGMHDDYVIGHEPMGIVEDVGPDVTRVKKGDRVIIPFNVACGHCYFCQHEMESQCDHANDAKDTGGMLGYSDSYGGFAGGQAELLRVPYGNFGPFVVPEDAEMEDEKLLFLSDIVPTAWWGVEHAGVKPGDTVIVLGCGPVGLLTQKFAWMKGASRVIAVDHVPYRLEHARRTNNVEIFNFEKIKDIEVHLKEITRGGADVVIDCVGLDAKKTVVEKVETALMLQGGSLGAFRIASEVVRKFGTIQLIGVYGLNYNMFPLGHLFERNVSLKMGQAPVIHYMPLLYQMIKEGKFDPTDIITHRLPISQGEHAYKVFGEKEEDCIKVILKP